MLEKGEDKKEIFQVKFQESQTRQVNQPKIEKNHSFSDELFLHFSSKIQNLTVFSIVHVIRFRVVRHGQGVATNMHR